jgi:hypothetical protein
MLKIDPSQIAQIEKDYPGIADQINRIEQMDLPQCPFCNSAVPSQFVLELILVRSPA